MKERSGGHKKNHEGRFYRESFREKKIPILLLINYEGFFVVVVLYVF